MTQRALAQEHRHDGARCRAQDVADDLLELFLGVRDVHERVEAQQRRRPALLLEVVGDSFRAPPDAVLVLVARRAQATRVLRAIPDLGGVGVDVLEAVEPTFHALVRGEYAGCHVADP